MSAFPGTLTLVLLRKILDLTLRSSRDRQRAVLLVFAMLIAAVLEAAGVALIMPFVALVQDPTAAATSRSLAMVARLLRPVAGAHLVQAMGVALVITFVVKNAFAAGVQRAQSRFIRDVETKLSCDLMARYLGSPYTFHLATNSSVLIQNVMLETYQLGNHVLVDLFLLTIELMTLAVVLAAMLFVEPVLVPIVGLVVLAIGFVFYRRTRRQSLLLGEAVKKNQAEMLKWLQQGLGGIKEVQVIGAEEFFFDAFRRAAERFNGSMCQYRNVQQTPRFALEAFGIVALVSISLGMLARGRSPSEVLPVLGVLAVAAVRVLPSASRIVASLTDLRHNVPSIEALHAIIETPVSEIVSTRKTDAASGTLLGRTLAFAGVDYRYPGADGLSLKNVSFEVRAGESIALVGSSGAGKTTIADLLIGLLEPTAGEILIDGTTLGGAFRRRWRESVGYIPQQVYLCDDSILRNIAFGVPDESIDRGRVVRALEMAQLKTFVEGLPRGLETFVGERGVRLSGGQRQRIGIARALYTEPAILVLDEATSALDSRTEQEIVDAIEEVRKGRTAIIIAHRLSTVRNCDRIVFMKGGQVLGVEPWDSLYAGNAEFRDLVDLAERQSSLAKVETSD